MQFDPSFFLFLCGLSYVEYLVKGLGLLTAILIMKKPLQSVLNRRR